MSTSSDKVYTFRGIESLVEVSFKSPEDFLKIKETLTRIGIASYKEKKLYQSCHILQKRGKYYIVHFKELFILDGKSSNISEDDWARRNTIANLLEDWGLLTIVNPAHTEEPVIDLVKVKIIKHTEKPEWSLIPKYNIGKKKKDVPAVTKDPVDTLE